MNWRLTVCLVGGAILFGVIALIMHRPPFIRRPATGERFTPIISAADASTKGSEGPTAKPIVANADELALQGGRLNSDYGEQVDESVVGRPFAFSHACKGYCPTTTLEQFTQEPRDLAWAASAEEAISKEIAREDPNKFAIRNIECRQTLCAVEVTSPRGGQLPLLLSLEQCHALGLNETVGWHTYEAGPSSGAVLVSDLFFVRSR